LLQSIKQVCHSLPTCDVAIKIKIFTALLVNGAHQLVMCCRSVATWWT